MRNCSNTVTSCPERASARAAAEPMIPAPTTATCTAPLSRSLERDCDLQVQLFPSGPAEVDLARRPARVPALLLRPAVDGLVGTQNLGEVALAAADLGKGDLTGGQHLVARPLGYADLDGTVLLRVDGTVVEDEGRADIGVPELLEARANVRLQLRNADTLRSADVRLLDDLLGENVVHGLLLEKTFQVAENPSTLGELFGRAPVELLQELDARSSEEVSDLCERHPASPQQGDQRGRAQLLAAVVAIPRFGIDAGGP